MSALFGFCRRKTVKQEEEQEGTDENDAFCFRGNNEPSPKKNGFSSASSDDDQDIRRWAKEIETTFDSPGGLSKQKSRKQQPPSAPPHSRSDTKDKFSGWVSIADIVETGEGRKVLGMASSDQKRWIKAWPQLQKYPEIQELFLADCGAGGDCQYRSIATAILLATSGRVPLSHQALRNLAAVGLKELLQGDDAEAKHWLEVITIAFDPANAGGRHGNMDPVFASATSDYLGKKITKAQYIDRLQNRIRAAAVYADSRSQHLDPHVVHGSYGNSFTLQGLARMLSRDRNLMRALSATDEQANDLVFVAVVLSEDDPNGNVLVAMPTNHRPDPMLSRFVLIYNDTYHVEHYQLMGLWDSSVGTRTILTYSQLPAFVRKSLL